MPTIDLNIESVLHKIEKKALELGRDPRDITVVAVTKTHPLEMIEEALRCGIQHIGENKVQEAVRKLPFIRGKYEGFHFIGHIQSNKINQILSLKPSLIHSVDSVYVAEKLSSALSRTNRTQDILVQVNTTGEETKSGVTFDNAIESIGQISMLNNLRIVGLMTIGMYSIDPERTRPYFIKLKNLFDQVSALNLPMVEMKYLSMGMTDDYLVAIEEGSNMVRIGSAIFGRRDYGDDR
ncbi:MAG: YggS family pyridoxal phosphate-dependent enzyme [Candidatus Cloacimonetes bacterium HGW-Cloacimonetes-1]|jgi:hypothetical protein|nr:MAG: YggS family pyridoxal phosphate-dependent enzyme [Candidatus Cloacimonetes bacterium HGW-Cloacimonetes-1]